MEIKLIILEVYHVFAFKTMCLITEARDEPKQEGNSV